MGERAETLSWEGWQLRPGRPLPFGATVVGDGINFSILSRGATRCTLVLFDRGAPAPRAEIPFPEVFRVGHTFSMVVLGLDPAQIEYGYRMEGPWNPTRGDRFDPSKILMDPFARAIGGREVWGAAPREDDPYPYRAQIVEDAFDWDGVRAPQLPMEELIIYEMHVRGFTRHSSAQVEHPGTFAGLIEKIPYLQELGVNCVELMPIFEFDELDNKNVHPETGAPLQNYWGYNTVGFFAPKAGLAATGAEGGQVRELKTLVRELHRAGIEVVLDVVFNHTAEGDHTGPTISYRGLDNRTWYLLDPQGKYRNYSGVGNTLNCNNPIVRNHVLECLRTWVAEYHIDGFRFDLASILGRDPQGEPLENPPLLEAIAYDPILASTKLIAEAWDAGGLYQVGRFPSYEGRWAEWNGPYRDTVRRFLRGDTGQTAVMALRLTGSPDLYPKRGTRASVNFVTCHDGFTLRDLVSYTHKYNVENGEQNRDGNDSNDAWNGGVEGPTDDPAIQRLRAQQMRNALAVLLISQGVPMLLMGDEVARTQRGNNNAYCHDADWNWLHWGDRDDNKEHFAFTQAMIAFRKAHPVLRRAEHLRGVDSVGSGIPDISWHGVGPWQPDHAPWSRTLAFMLCGRHAPESGERGDTLYIAMNMHWEPHAFGLPTLPDGLSWHRGVDTTLPGPQAVAAAGSEPLLTEQAFYRVGARSVVVLVGRHASPEA